MIGQLSLLLVPKQGLLRAGRCLSFHLYIFSSQKKFAKKVIVVIGVPHGMKVKCDLLGQKHKRNLLRRKNFFVTQEGTLYFLFDAGHGRAICCEGEVKLNASDK